MSDTESGDGAGRAAWRDLPYLRGTAAGLVAALLGYGLTYLLRSGGVERRLRRPAVEGGFLRATPANTSGVPDAIEGGYNVSTAGPREIVGGNLTEVGAGSPGTPRVVGWLYTDLHNVPLRGEHTVATTSRVYAFDLSLVADSGGLLLAVPPLLLLAAGYLLATRGAGADRDPRTAAAAGATVALGYAVGVGLLAWLSFWRARGAPEAYDGTVVFEYAFGPDLLLAVAVAGVAYPLVCGGAGGYLAGRAGPTLAGGATADAPADGERPGPAADVVDDDPAEWGDDVYSTRDLETDDDADADPGHRPGGPAAGGEAASAGGGEVPTVTGSEDGVGPEGSVTGSTPGAAGGGEDAGATTTADGDPATDEGVDYRDVDYDERKYMPDTDEEGEGT